MKQTEKLGGRIVVYTAQFPFDTVDGILPPSRQREIDLCANEKVKQSKFYVFKLLERALKEIYNVSLSNASLTRLENGKWTCPLCEISLTHCKDVVAVALSFAPVGIDVELIDGKRFDANLQNRILTDNEKSYAQRLPHNLRSLYVNYAWTVKEALFKRSNGSAYVPSKTETHLSETVTKTVLTNADKYILTVTCGKAFKVEFNCENIVLEDFSVFN